MTIIDRRSSKKKSVTNRQKFIKRYKKHIKERIADVTSDKGITDVLKDREITIDEYDVSEPTFHHDPSRGRNKHVLNGNETMEKGDRVRQPPQDDGQGPQGSDDGDGFDEFTFTLTKEEFLELYFSDMELPDFIKENLKGSNKTKWKRHGFTKEGIPSRVDLPKTLKQALARRIATKSKTYLDNVDLRYKHFVKQPYPIKHAVMFCMMDVSASMGEDEKEMAKRFFLLLYLFLNKNYDNIDVRFVRHTQDADEVDEQTFFYGQETGGTIVSSGLHLINEIIDNEYSLDKTNIYVSQASDGDNWMRDMPEMMREVEEMLPKVQYFTYIEVDPSGRKERYSYETIFDNYISLVKQHENMSAVTAASQADIYPALRKLFGGDE